MHMKISEDVLYSKGIAYIKKYPYGDLSKVSKNGKRHYLPKIRTLFFTTLTTKDIGTILVLKLLSRNKKVPNSWCAKCMKRCVRRRGTALALG